MSIARDVLRRDRYRLFVVKSVKSRTSAGHRLGNQVVTAVTFEPENILWFEIAVPSEDRFHGLGVFRPMNHLQALGKAKYHLTHPSS
jgi:hypothetical protein